MNTVRIKYAIKSSYLFERFYRFQKARKKNPNLKCIYDKKIPNTYRKIIERTSIRIDPARMYQYWIDEDLYFCHFENVLGNMPPNFGLITNNSLCDIQNMVNNYPDINGLKSVEDSFLCTIKKYLKRIINEIETCQESDYLLQTKKYYENMERNSASSLREALQRILFWDSIFWQTGHNLIGLGRLDVILDPFLTDAEKNKEDALNEIKEFLLALHAHYEYKSATLKGDIGQIIILGGKQPDGTYFHNIFSELFIQACKELHLPDPKCLLRCSKDIPKGLIELSIESLLTGIGGPVLANDDVIIPSLEGLGYPKEKACNYAFSACWEPLSYGDSFGQNNFPNLNFCECANEAIKVMIDISNPNWKELIEVFLDQIDIKIKEIVAYSNRKQFEVDPLFSLFTEGCLIKGIDISKGGAINNDFGVLSVGLSNALNSLLNVKILSLTNGDYTLKELVDAAEENFNSPKGKEILHKVQTIQSSFGHDDESVIELCNHIIGHVNDEFGKYTNSLKGKFKFGLSSPAYIDQGKVTKASLDGRRDGDPLSTHISVNDGSVAYTELFCFASKLKYGEYTANGNVVDVIFSPDMVRNNMDKFTSLIYGAIGQGVYEIQINVMSSSMLIEAKKHPELYPNLIVRVWGFSAYFNDLPEEYQNLLIQRAIESEKAN